MGRSKKCWAAEHLGQDGCDGRLIRAHLIPKQRIKAQVGLQLRKDGLSTNQARDRVVWDPRVWIPLCGGPTGISGHHGALDYARTLRIPRAKLPPELEEFAAEYGLEWSLEADYGPKEV